MADSKVKMPVVKNRTRLVRVDETVGGRTCDTIKISVDPKYVKNHPALFEKIAELPSEFQSDKEALDVESRKKIRGELSKQLTVLAGLNAALKWNLVPSKRGNGDMLCWTIVQGEDNAESHRIAQQLVDVLRVFIPKVSYGCVAGQETQKLIIIPHFHTISVQTLEAVVEHFQKCGFAYHSAFKDVTTIVYDTGSEAEKSKGSKAEKPFKLVEVADDKNEEASDKEFIRLLSHTSESRTTRSNDFVFRSQYEIVKDNADIAHEAYFKYLIRYGIKFCHYTDIQGKNEGSLHGVVIRVIEEYRKDKPEWLPLLHIVDLPRAQSRHVINHGCILSTLTETEAVQYQMEIENDAVPGEICLHLKSDAIEHTPRQEKYTHWSIEVRKHDVFIRLNRNVDMNDIEEACVKSVLEALSKSQKPKPTTADQKQQLETTEALAVVQTSVGVSPSPVAQVATPGQSNKKKKKKKR